MICWLVLTRSRVACGIAAPLGSRTMPEMLPPVAASNGFEANRQNAIARQSMLLRAGPVEGCGV